MRVDAARAVLPFRSIYLGQWRIDITDRHDPVQLPISRAALARTIAGALESGAAPKPASVGLVLSDDAELADLNERHLGHEGATDVVSFPLLPPEAFGPHAGRTAGGARQPVAFALPPGSRTHLGEIVVSVERAIEQASEGRGGQTGDVRWEPADELRLLVAHGTLHLCGWDHADPVEGEAMRSLERRLLAGE